MCVLPGGSGDGSGEGIVGPTENHGPALLLLEKLKEVALLAVPKSPVPKEEVVRGELMCSRLSFGKEVRIF